MATKFVHFEDVNGNAVYVNPERVTFVREAQSDETQIFFGAEHALRVKGRAADVASRIADE
ncbi:hypothetical protein ACN22W_09420 [Burkholderia theae]|uniref:hypothetical protein n=1 Tax=Burkholderia theae TaxID=3143496 RepID=UPI003AFA833C